MIIGTSLEKRVQRVKSTNQTGIDLCRQHGLHWRQRVATRHIAGTCAQ
jgi:hypothetical protein